MIIIKGAGDIASGIAVRLFRAGYRLVMTELCEPTAIRRTVAFSEAIRLGSTSIEQIQAARVNNITEYNSAIANEIIPVIPLTDNTINFPLPQADAIVDARLAKINIDTRINEAPVVIGIGPGFTAGMDCHAVIETKRGHYLGRVYYSGRAAENTGIPGIIGGYGEERVLRAPCDGVIKTIKNIGDYVNADDVVAYIDGVPMVARISGVLRGLLPYGLNVTKGMKSGDVDPRNEKDYCASASDKALAVGGGVLEALLCFNVLPLL